MVLSRCPGTDRSLFISCIGQHRADQTEGASRKHCFWPITTSSCLSGRLFPHFVPDCCPSRVGAGPRFHVQILPSLRKYVPLQVGVQPPKPVLPVSGHELLTNGFWTPRMDLKLISSGLLSRSERSFEPICTSASPRIKPDFCHEQHVLPHARPCK